MSKRQFNTTGQELLQQLLDHTKRDENNGCLLWQGYLTGNGYPQCTALDKRMWSVHRLVLYLTTGYEDTVAMHSCDTKKCINPKHLSWGDQRDNIQDAIQKERYTQHIGTNNPGAKLTEEHVRNIHATLIKTKGQYGAVNNLARIYGVSKDTINRIKQGTYWKHLGLGKV